MHTRKSFAAKLISVALCSTLVFQNVPCVLTYAGEVSEDVVLTQTTDETTEDIEEVSFTYNYKKLGNKATNIQAGGQIVELNGVEYYSDATGTYSMNEDGSKNVLFSRTIYNMNAAEGKLYYTKGGSNVYAYDMTVKSESKVLSLTDTIKRMYVADDTNLVYITEGGELYVYDMVTDETSPLIAENLVNAIPTEKGFIKVKGQVNDYSIVVEDKTVYSHIADYYYDNDVLQILDESGDSYISLDNLFSANATSLDVNGDYGVKVDTAELFAEMEEVDEAFAETSLDEKVAEENLVELASDDVVAVQASEGTSVSTNAGQKNAVARAYSMTLLKWKPLKTVKGWKDKYTFTAGTTYVGTPYAQNCSKGYYIGYGISVDGFKVAVNDANSKFYTARGENEYTTNGVSTYYGSDCSGFVSYCWGVSRNVCSGLAAKSTKIGTDTTKLVVGDALISSGHVVMVTDVKKNSSGTITLIEISEQTTPQARTKTYSSAADVKTKYISNGYTIYRYGDIKSVTAPDQKENDLTKESELTATNYTVPEKISEGSSFTLKANLTSNYIITKITGSILDSTGKAVITSTMNPYDLTSNISIINTEIKFGTLSAGDYTYKLVAYDEKGSKTLIEAPFVVEKSASGPLLSTLAGSGITYPITLTQGTGHSVKGTVSSNYKITNVTVQAIDADGKAVINVKATPNATSYDLSALNNSVLISKLPAGSYTYKVIATDEKQTKTLLSKAFTINSSSSSTAASTLAGSGITYPITLNQGTGHSVKGTISSNYKITKVVVQAIDSSSKAVINVSATPNAKTYDLSALNNSVLISKLTAGSYTYKVTATDEKQTKTLVNKAFTIAAPTSAMKIASYTYPTYQVYGKGFTVKGAITSDYNISKVTVSVLNSSGTAVITQSASPAAKSYNVSALDSKIKFGTLAKGTYTYKIVAKDSVCSKTLVDKKFYICDASTMKIASYNYPSTLLVGDGFSFKGAITSNYNLTNVTVAIKDKDAKVVTSATAEPNAKSYDVKNLSSKIKFGSLAKGTYSYVVTAKDQMGTKTLVNKSFTVTPSKLAIASYTYPTTLKKGSSFSIKGTITSNVKISNVTITVVNSSGKAVITQKATPNATKYEVKNLNSKVKFGSLAKGTYTYKITAKDAKQTKTLVSKKFTVK